LTIDNSQFTINRPFQTLNSETAWSCPWYAVRRDEIVLPNGRHAHYHVVEKAPAVWIIPVTAEGEIVLIYSYRYTVDDWCWELPAGAIKPGQTAEEAARAELREEVGGTAADLIYIGQFYPANGICNEVGHIFLATAVCLGETDHEPAEVITVHRKPIREALRMAQANEISDGPSALALLLCADRLRN
jgi:8-oxo-dGTP pyrophosphatase MutT (NUDIX family)